MKNTGHIVSTVLLLFQRRQTYKKEKIIELQLSLLFFPIKRMFYNKDDIISNCFYQYI